MVLPDIGFSLFFKEGIEIIGVSKGTLHYMKKNAKAEKPFTLNKHVRERLDGANKSINAKQK
jgi:hypothetical protein